MFAQPFDANPFDSKPAPTGPLSEIEFAALLVSRVCHDLVGPLGAVVNGMEVLEDERDAEMRADAIRLTRAEERPITVETLIKASEVFLTNALGVRSVVMIGDRPVGDGEPGLITQMVATRV